jgi:hypothetical protein
MVYTFRFLGDFFAKKQWASVCKMYMEIHEISDCGDGVSGDN